MSFVLTVASIKQEGDQMVPSRRLFDCLLMVVSLRNNFGRITRIVPFHHGTDTHSSDSTIDNHQNLFGVFKDNVLESQFRFFHNEDFQP